MAKLASKHRTSNICLPTSKNVFDPAESKTFMLAHVQNVLAKHEMFEEIGGGETNKQGQEVVVVSCQPNNVGQFRQAFKH